MIQKIIHRTARNKELTWEENILANKAFKMMPEWKGMFWDDIANRSLIEDHFPQFLEKYDSISRGVMKADVARLVYMHAYGGVYMDTDYKIIKPLGSKFIKEKCVFGIECGRIGKDGKLSEDFKIGNAFFAAEKGHPFFKAMIEDIFSKHPFENLTDFQLMKISGPHGLTKFYSDNIEKFKDIKVYEFGVFFPDMKWSGLRAKKMPNTVGIHLSWGSWRTKRLSSTIKNRLRRIVSSL